MAKKQTNQLAGNLQILSSKWPFNINHVSLSKVMGSSCEQALEDIHLVEDVLTFIESILSPDMGD